MSRLILIIAATLTFGGPGFAGDKTLLAVFAHPDDESTVAPLLARYAREGAKVVVAIATDGRYGTNDFSGLEAGDGLAEVRRDEMQCAADKLGVELVHFSYHDQLKAAEGYDGHIPHVRALIMDVAGLVEELQPDAIITWGPDGGSNHMDHRLVGATVSGVFLSREWDKEIGLYFYGTPASLVDGEDGKILYGVADRYMTTVIEFEAEDFDAAVESFRCHESQFSAESIGRMIDNKKRLGNKIYLRRFEPPGEERAELF